GSWHKKYLLLFKAKTRPRTHLISIMEICALCLMLRMYVSLGGNLLTSFIDGILGKYIGHLKDRSFKDQMAKDPTEVIMHLLNLLRLSLSRFLPDNSATMQERLFWSSNTLGSSGCIARPSGNFSSGSPFGNVLYSHVKGMRLFDVLKRDRKLRTFAGSEHPFHVSPIDPM
ncbi:hypothetical protein RJ639_045136, partial [Escallonia herrerae]